jgi:hypothetical protein
MQTAPDKKALIIGIARPPRAFGATFKFTGHRHVPLAAHQRKITLGSVSRKGVAISASGATLPDLDRAADRLNL